MKLKDWKKEQKEFIQKTSDDNFAQQRIKGKAKIFSKLLRQLFLSAER